MPNRKFSQYQLTGTPNIQKKLAGPAFFLLKFNMGLKRDFLSFRVRYNEEKALRVMSVMKESVFALKVADAFMRAYEGLSAASL